jgi:hypothetical protein
MYLTHEHHPVCFGDTCMKDDTFVSIVIAMAVLVLFSVPILYYLIVG